MIRTPQSKYNILLIVSVQQFTGAQHYCLKSSIFSALFSSQKKKTDQRIAVHEKHLFSSIDQSLMLGFRYDGTVSVAQINYDKIKYQS